MEFAKVVRVQDRRTSREVEGSLEDCQITRINITFLSKVLSWCLI